jgi:hypothetical protein
LHGNVSEGEARQCPGAPANHIEFFPDGKGEFDASLVVKGPGKVLSAINGEI